MAHATPTRASTNDPGGPDPRWRVTPTKAVVAVILLAAIVVPLLVSTYDQIDPRLFGFPFFYWYQLAWVFLAAICCSVSFYLLKRERDAYARSHPPVDPVASTRTGGER
jgi:Na+/proline symporter